MSKRREGGSRCLPVLRSPAPPGWRSAGRRLPVLLLLLCGCQRGCARAWFERHGVGEPGGAPAGGGMINAIDCPDGLARCVDGVVEVSRLATLPRPCVGRPEGCTCPWERAGECDRGCVVSSVEPLVMEPARALGQLCAPAPDAGSLTRLASRAGQCEEDVQYRCSGGAVIACAERSVVAVCERGCAGEGSEIGSEMPVDREGAFAILCSR